MKYLLDTNVISELRKARTGKADPGVVNWASRIAAPDLYLSVMTVQEIEIGVLLAERRDAEKGRILRRWYEEMVLPSFSSRILAIDLAVARRSASLHVPDLRPYRDALIGATALVHGMTLVTRNDKDFRGIGVPLLNPWTA